MAVSSFACPTCGAALDSSATDTPTITCKYCGTVVKNPFFREDSAADRVAMPVININITPPISGVATPVPTPPIAAPPAPPQPVSMPPRAEYFGTPYIAPTESPKNWTLTFLLCLFLGWIGAHRFYTGHYIVGLIQFFTMGGFGIWWLIDLVLILTGVYRDTRGLPLSGRRFGKRAAIVFAAVVLFVCIGACVGLVFIGENATKVDLPADRGWITGIDRCQGSVTFGELIQPDAIPLWEGWGTDRGNIVGRLKHDTAVSVLEARRHTDGTITYYKVRTEAGLQGWVSEEVIQFQPVSEGPVPREEC